MLVLYNLSSCSDILSTAKKKLLLTITNINHEIYGFLIARIALIVVVVYFIKYSAFIVTKGNMWTDKCQPNHPKGTPNYACNSYHWTSRYPSRQPDVSNRCQLHTSIIWLAVKIFLYMSPVSPIFHMWIVDLKHVPKLVVWFLIQFSHGEQTKAR